MRSVNSMKPLRPHLKSDLYLMYMHWVKNACNAWASNRNNISISTGTCWKHSALARDQIDAANDYVCGTMTIEGAPFLKEEHFPVFDCANKNAVKKDSATFMHTAISG